MCDFNKKLNKNFQVFFEIENFNKIKRQNNDKPTR